MVNGEFVNYSGGYRWKNPAVMVPEDPRYLAAHHIGMTAWTLGLPGVMNSTNNLSSTTKEPHGCGQLVKSWFSRMSSAPGAQDGPGGVLLPGGAGVDHRGEQPLGQGGARPRRPTPPAHRNGITSHGM